MLPFLVSTRSTAIADFWLAATGELLQLNLPSWALQILASSADQIKNFAVIYLIDISEVPDFNTMYELYDPCTVMFFFRNKVRRGPIILNRLHFGSPLLMLAVQLTERSCYETLSPSASLEGHQ